MILNYLYNRRNCSIHIQTAYRLSPINTVTHEYIMSIQPQKNFFQRLYIPFATTLYRAVANSHHDGCIADEGTGHTFQDFFQLPQPKDDSSLEANNNNRQGIHIVRNTAEPSQEKLHSHYRMRKGFRSAHTL